MVCCVWDTERNHEFSTYTRDNLKAHTIWDMCLMCYQKMEIKCKRAFYHST